MQDDNPLPYLCVGLARAYEQDFHYPFNDSNRPEDEGRSILLYALSRLATEMTRHGQLYTYTLPQIFDLFEEPIEKWWPGGVDHLPSDVEPYITLLDEKRLDYVDEWLELNVGTLPATIKNLSVVHEFIADKTMDQWVHYCREGPDDLAEKYVQSRYFVVRNPWTTPAKLAQQERIWGPKIYEFVLNFYESYAHFHQRTLHQGKYHLCPHCQGILEWRDGRPACAKHSVCGVQSRDYRNARSIPPANQMRLRPTIHKRICIPGLPEVDLYHWLTDDPAGPRLSKDSVALWPGVDRYDLRLDFNNQVWAVDVKDYTSPVALGLKEKEKGGFKNYTPDDFLHWQRAFYVIPDYRFDRDKRYDKRVKDALGKARGRDVEVFSLSRFQREVVQNV